MDRQIAHAILFAVACTTLLGLYFFSGSAPSDNRTFAPGDIRYTSQQAELKNKKRRKTATAAPTQSSSDSTDEASTEEPPAEEPEIE